MGPTSGAGGLLFPLVLASLAGLVLIAIARRRQAATLQPAVAASLASDAVEMPAQALRPVTPRPAPTGEEHVPRWRRPSVTAARFDTANSIAVRAATAASTPPARTPRVFTEPIVDVAERMLVRFDSVPLLDQPDEALGRTREELDSGDEVGVLERDEIWARVTTPTGLVGWVAAMALAAPASAGATRDLASGDGIEPEPARSPDGPPPLETLLEAIAAERRALQERPAGTESPVGRSPSRSKRLRKSRAGARPS